MCQLEVVATDPEKQSLGYSWECTDGEFTTVKTQRSVTWKAPESNGSFVITARVTDGDLSVEDNIILTVSENPVLQVDQDSLSFGETLDTLELEISNAGTGTLNWSIDINTDDGGDWLFVDPIEGITTTETENVTVYIDRTLFSSIQYTGQLKITSNDGEATVVVDAELAHPTLSINTDELLFGESEETLSFYISNTGSDTLKWSIDAVTSDGEEWISLNPKEGNTTTETDQIDVFVDRSNFISGSYTGSINITSNGGEATINVEAEAHPELKVNKNELQFGKNILLLDFIISNSGTGSLEWTINSSTDVGGNWLSVDPSEGNTGSENDIVSVSVDRSGLTPGRYTGTVTVVSNGGEATILVELEAEEITTKLYLRSNGDLFLSNEQTPPTSTIRVYFYSSSNTTREWTATLENSITSNEYSFSFWFGADSPTGYFDVSLLVDENGTEKELASTEFTVPNNPYYKKYTDTVTGQSGGNPGDLLILRISYSGSYRGAILFGYSSGSDSHITVPGAITVSHSSSSRIMAEGTHEKVVIDKAEQPGKIPYR
jgi:hypothetical protein